ncbi:MAG: hypothetical protein OEW82_07330 [Dehalococcoidia bacterium]|nr:hypothetical protein [Dehalococcoidia bacterium]
MQQSLRRIAKDDDYYLCRDALGLDAGRSWAIGLPGRVSLRGATAPKQSLRWVPSKAHLKS